MQAPCDTVLLVNDASARWHFNDDSQGLNPGLTLPAAADGVYDIWIGTFGQSGCTAQLEVQTTRRGAPPSPPPPPTATCPDPGQNGQMLTYDARGLWSAQRFNVVAGGNLDLRACGSVPGHGWIVQRPDFTLNLTANPQRYDLEFRVEASCDPVLLVSDPLGRWSFNDDRDGLNPGLQLDGAMAGRYAIWLGTYGPTPCDAQLTLQGIGAEPTKPGRPTPPIPVPGGADLVWRFLNDPMGWTARDAQLSMVPGSHMQITAWGDSRVGYLIAPREALGDWRGVTGIEARMRPPGMRDFDGFSEGGVGDLVLYNGTMTAAARFPHWLGPDWARVEVPLRGAVTLGGTRL